MIQCWRSSDAWGFSIGKRHKFTFSWIRGNSIRVAWTTTKIDHHSGVVNCRVRGISWRVGTQ